jgi:hypothetical protein
LEAVLAEQEEELLLEREERWGLVKRRLAELQLLRPDR